MVLQIRRPRQTSTALENRCTIADMTTAPRLRMTNISKAFPGVQALENVSIDVRQGEVLGIIGENGAGKSTLIKTLGGAHPADTGKIELDGNVLELDSPYRAQAAGIGIIYQEFNLVSSLMVRENIFLGRAKHTAGIIDARSERSVVHDLFQSMGMPIDPDTPVSQLSIAEKQLVEIAKALHTDVRVLVMDEPTATLTPHEASKLFDIVAELKRHPVTGSMSRVG